jgi:hypothetical protein
MLFMRRILCVPVLAAVFAATAAQASPILTASVGAAPDGLFYANFDNLPLGGAGGAANSDISVAFTGDGQTVTGALPGKYAAPYLDGNGVLFGDGESGPDTTRYLSTGIGSVILTFAAPQTYLGLLWGSADLYNSLALYDGGSLVVGFTGADVNAAADGDQGINGTYYVNISGLDPFDRAVFTSADYAFEIDDVAYNVDPPGPVPEPLTLSLFVAGLAGMAAMRRKPV